jgi:nucleoid DNA-binding protein
MNTAEKPLGQGLSGGARPFYPLFNADCHWPQNRASPTVSNSLRVPFRRPPKAKNEGIAMTVTKTQLADAYSAALTKALGHKFTRRDASRFLDALWPVVSDLALKDTKKTKPGSVPLGSLGRLKMRYKAATKARKGTNPFTGEPATFKAKPATLQPRFTAGKALKDQAGKYFKKKLA